MIEIRAPMLHLDKQSVFARVELAPEAGVPTKTLALTALRRVLEGAADDGAGAAPGQWARRPTCAVKTRFAGSKAQAQASHAQAAREQ
jgi:hypothetical protein